MTLNGREAQFLLEVLDAALDYSGAETHYEICKCSLRLTDVMESMTSRRVTVLRLKSTLCHLAGKP